MVAPNPENDEEARFRILFEIERAIADLKSATSAVNTFSGKVQLVINKAKELGDKYNVAAYNVARAMQEVNKSFGATGIDSGVMSKAVSQTKQIGVEAHTSATKVNILRTALGTLVALGVFQLIQFFVGLGQAMVQAAQNADKLTRAIIDLRNIERILSMQGVEVSMRDLFEIVSDLRKEFHLISQLDLTDLVSQAAIATREFGFSLEQIKEVSRVAAAIAETQNIDYKSALDAVVRSLSGRSQGNQVLKSAGIFLTEQEIKLRAVNLGLAENTKNVSQAATAQAVLNLELEKAAGLLSEVGELEASDAGRVAALKEQYEDLLTDLGTGFYSVVANAADGLSLVLKLMDQGINRLKLFVVSFQSLLYAARETTKAVLDGALATGQDLGQIFGQTFDAYFGNAVASAFKTPVDADTFGIESQKLTDLLNSYITAGDTATSTTLDLGQAFELTAEQSDAIQDKLEDLARDLERLGNRKVEIDLNYTQASERALADLLLKEERALEDFQYDVLQLQKETNDKIEDANRKYRNREKNEEAKFQEKLRQLREKFLFDLEDALRERDARQVLRLIRQYNLDKEQAIREHNLAKQERAREHAEEIADIRKQAADKLAELQHEFELRRQREREDAEIAQQRRDEEYKQALAQLQTQIEEKLRTVASALAQELGLTAEGAAAIYELLNSFYGPAGYFDNLYDYSYSSLIAKTETFLAQLQKIAADAQAQANAQIQASTNTTGGGGGSAPGGGFGQPPPAHPFASGGAAVANKPTRALFGEKENELALFVPFNKLDSFLQTLSGVGSGSQTQDGGKGSLRLDISLSEGLEAKIVDRSVGAVADVVATINRNRK